MADQKEKARMAKEAEIKAQAEQKASEEAAALAKKQAE